jgi:hypothetical protein
VNNNDDSRWATLPRGSILAATISKHIQYVGFTDRRAQGMITISALLVPVALSGIQNPVFQLGSAIAVITSVLTVFFAILSLYPKSSHTKHDHTNFLHFSDIQKLSEEEYMCEMQSALEDTGKLSEMAVMEIYHLSALVLGPKFKWLKVSYWVFLLGNVGALLSIAYSLIG